MKVSILSELNVKKCPFFFNFEERKITFFMEHSKINFLKNCYEVLTLFSYLYITILVTT